MGYFDEKISFTMRVSIQKILPENAEGLSFFWAWLEGVDTYPSRVTKGKGRYSIVILKLIRDERDFPTSL